MQCGTSKARLGKWIAFFDRHDRFPRWDTCETAREDFSWCAPQYLEYEQENRILMPMSKRGPAMTPAPHPAPLGCGGCGNVKATRVCQRCKGVLYCDEICQRRSCTGENKAATSVDNTESLALGVVELWRKVPGSGGEQVHPRTFEAETEPRTEEEALATWRVAEVGEGIGVPMPPAAIRDQPRVTGGVLEAELRYQGQAMVVPLKLDPGVQLQFTQLNCW
eukprot:Skav206970  [mRNA]  locus=scaffold1515:43630:46190:+ [translate_table: standard]